MDEQNCKLPTLRILNHALKCRTFVIRSRFGVVGIYFDNAISLLLGIVTTGSDLCINRFFSLIIRRKPCVDDGPVKYFV